MISNQPLDRAGWGLISAGVFCLVVGFPVTFLYMMIGGCVLGPVLAVFLGLFQLFAGIMLLVLDRYNRRTEARLGSERLSTEDYFAQDDADPYGSSREMASGGDHSEQDPKSGL